MCLGYFLRKDQVTVFVSWWIIIYDMKNNIKLVASNNFTILRRSGRSVIIHKVILGFSYLTILCSSFRSVWCSDLFLLYDQYLQQTTFSFPSLNTPVLIITGFLGISPIMTIYFHENDNSICICTGELIQVIGTFLPVSFLITC